MDVEGIEFYKDGVSVNGVSFVVGINREPNWSGE